MMVQVLAGHHMRKATDHVAVSVTAADVTLPASIQANREPYMQGDWRKEPYAPRCRHSAAFLIFINQNTHVLASIPMLS